MKKDRMEEIKEGLEKDIYKKIEKLEDIDQDEELYGPHTTTLANFLPEEEEEIKTIEFIKQEEVELEINSKEVLKDYDDYIHKTDTISEKGSLENIEMKEFEQNNNPNQEEEVIKESEEDLQEQFIVQEEEKINSIPEPELVEKETAPEPVLEPVIVNKTIVSPQPIVNELNMEDVKNLEEMNVQEENESMEPETLVNNEGISISALSSQKQTTEEMRAEILNEIEEDIEDKQEEITNKEMEDDMINEEVEVEEVNMESIEEPEVEDEQEEEIKKIKKANRKSFVIDFILLLVAVGLVLLILYLV